MPESLGLDVRCPDHLGPHLDLGRDAGRELLRRARDHVVAKGSEPLLHVRLREDFGALAVKDRDNLRRGAGGNKDAMRWGVVALSRFPPSRGVLGSWPCP